jgi:tetratricopeptide (TPR) repeat protein
MTSGGLICALLVFAWGERGSASPPPRDARRDLTPTARELSDRGLRQYQAGDLDAAIESFMGAFALSDNTGLLFNVAQAYRLKGDCALAKEYYSRYLVAAPESSLKPTVERRLIEMDSCIQTTKPTLAPPARLAPEVQLQAAPATHGVSLRRHAVTWTLRGSAAALVTSAAVFGGLAWDAKRDFDATPLQVPATAANDRYQLNTALAATFVLSGVACAVVSYFVERGQP